jgi:hypothetical protein
VIQDNKVVNVIVFDGGAWSPPRGSFIVPEVSGVDIGWTHDPETGLFSPPPVVETEDGNI